MPSDDGDEEKHSILKKQQFKQVVYVIVGLCAWTLAKEAGGIKLLILNLSTHLGYQPWLSLQEGPCQKMFLRRP
ncbi:hypothetical protein [Bremerella sp.]|uniref:hypothetical protein n=1 Tax=Bremerella sp. TaxID=2795602 RepID=UPI00391C6C58